MKIEVCINRLEDVQSLQGLFVDRIELCIELGCGGLTPSLAMVEEALALSQIPIHVLVRPRSGDFVYTKHTLRAMTMTCRQLEILGVAGIVTGVLKRDAQLPIEVLSTFRKTIQNCALYFHRAFDEVTDPEGALLQLKHVGFDGVLTSGQQQTAIEGMDRLLAWKHLVGDTLVILPGSGINANNCLKFREAGFDWIHLSAKKLIHPEVDSKFSSPQYGLNIEELKQVLSLLKK